jgi:hypothetical protein
MIPYVLAALLTVTPAVAQDAGLTAWDKIYRVFSHPRCANCHVGEDNVPIWSGFNYDPDARPHGMNINAGPTRNGAGSIACNACHTRNNSLLPHGPPGAEGWLLAPIPMQWFGKSSAEICAQIKDPTRNGDRTIAKIAEHIEKEPLVLWGWRPGPGREPAPYSAAEVAAFLRDWETAHAPCP